MAFETILYQVDGGVATIIFNRPERLNAFNQQMTQETVAALKNAGRDPAVRCLVISGSGRAFSAGQDLQEMQAALGPQFSVSQHLAEGFNRLVALMTSLEKPIVGAINGVAAGAGCSIALATDIRLASENAGFMQAFSRVGLVPDSGSTWFLPHMIGYARAYQMAVTGETVPAEQALAWGLVNQVVPAAQLAETAAAWAQKLAAGPTLAFGLTKRAMRQAFEKSLPQMLEYEGMLQELAVRSADSAEGIGAFLEKRPPQFRGL